MIKLTSILKDKYYRYQPGEFLPVYSNGELLNKREFHLYKLRNLRRTYHQLTHYAN